LNDITRHVREQITQERDSFYIAYITGLLLENLELSVTVSYM